MTVMCYVVGFVGFLLCWFVVAVVVGLGMVLIFPPGRGPYSAVGIVFDWRNLPGITLGLLAGIHSFRASIRRSAPVDNLFHQSEPRPPFLGTSAAPLPLRLAQADTVPISSMDESIPPSLQELLRRELAPNERLLWQARPAPLSRMLASSGRFFFGIPFFAFSVFWTWGATDGFARTHGSHDGGFGWFGLLWGGMFMLIGASMLLSPLWAWWVARRTLYAITDRRALLIEAPFRRTIQSFADERLSTVVRREGASGRGDLIFERQASRGSKGRTVYRDIGFFGLADARGVEQLLRTTYASLNRAPTSES